MSWLAPLSPHLATGARERRGQVLVRVLLAFLLAWIFHTIGRPELILPWLGLSAAAQLIEYRIMAPFRDPSRPPPRQAGPILAALAAIALMAVIHAAAAGLAWAQGGPIVITAAVLILVGGIINNIASGIESRPLFLIGATPYLAVLAAMPAITMASGRADHLALLAVTVALFFLAVLSVWARVNRAHMAEIDAVAEAQSRLEQAEAAMADRAAMAAIVSHELRTPVSAILAGAHVIRHGDRPEKTPQTADLIIDAGRLMTSMLNDLLDHSKIEARAMTLETRDFDLDALLTDVARFWAAPAEEKGLAFAVNGTGAATWLRGDPYRLRQILNNLISNAIKFTPRGAVTLDAAVSAVEGGRRLRLTVRDQGAGIAPEAMSRLFTPFAQGSAEVARTYGGTGLGLTVSRDLARLMSGDLTVESAAGDGAAFTLDVVLAPGEPVEAHDEYDAPAPAMDRRLRVLAVDDHEINRRTLALVLQPLDVDLATASDGASALDILARQTFDVVLMDVNMPGIDGNEATRRLRASDGPNADTPVIGFSAGTEAAQVAACREAGMTDWLAKPLEPGKLYAALERAVRSGRETEAA